MPSNQGIFVQVTDPKGLTVWLDFSWSIWKECSSKFKKKTNSQVLWRLIAYQLFQSVFT